VVDAQWSLGFLVRPSDAIHIDQIPAPQYRGRDSRKDVLINEPGASRRVRGKVVPPVVTFRSCIVPPVSSKLRQMQSLSLRDPAAVKKN
jgi:hypothetical protein